MSTSPERRAHQEWLGFVQPVGLVVSLTALEKAQCYVHKNILELQDALRRLARPDPGTLRRSSLAPGAAQVERPSEELVLVPSIQRLCSDVLGWQEGDLSAAGERFSATLPEYDDTLRPSFVVSDPDDPHGAIALISVIPRGLDFDESRSESGWDASPEARLERLLRETHVPIGILFNERQLRLVYAPRGESSGHVTFSFADMVKAPGRPLLGGLHALLSADRLFNLPPAQRLPEILRQSRQHQNDVSTQLSRQVLEALHELVRGFQAADQDRDGALLG